MIDFLLIAETATAAANGDHAVSTGVTILFGLILAAMIAALALEEKLHAKKSIIVGTFAGLCMILGVLTGLIGHTNGSEGDGNADLPIYVEFIDWGVITIILGASLFVEVTSRSGVFTWMAISLTRKSGGDPFRLLIFYGLLTVFFSAVLNNVTAMIIIGSLTTVSLRKLGRNDLLLGFLLTEGMLTNVGGLLTLISSVPNIIVGKVAGISFAKFFLVAAPYVFVATAATLLMARWRFSITGLKTETDKADARRLVESFDATESVPSQSFFWFSVAALVAFIGCLAGQSALPFGLNQLDMGFVALFFAGVVLLAYKHEVDKFYAVVDWDLLAFFAGLFVVIHVLEHAQVLAVLGRGISALLQLPSGINSMSLVVSSAIASSVTDNIPLSAVLARVLGNMQTPGDSPFWWCVIFGANLGGNLTPIGSASTVVAMTIIHRQKLDLTFVGFVKAAAPFAVLQIILAMMYVLIAV
ncbi:MAG: hypothetical protein KDA91_00465 [Planctomycetaceae bacterium]|nr:hypothetical protein [Planctomycetaceae bacterium]